jgi:hypothetical protein
VLATELNPKDLAGYPPQGRGIAIDRLSLFRELPFPYLVVLLRELVVFDWKFPAERRRLKGQLEYLASLDLAHRNLLMQGFGSIRLDDAFLRSNWVMNPSAALEQLTAWLWTSHQMDRFRESADAFEAEMSARVPPLRPTQPRLGIVVLGDEVKQPRSPLFRKLRAHGVYLQSIRPEGGFVALLDAVKGRAVSSSARSEAGDRFLHWYVDGGTPAEDSVLTQVSYGGLQEARQVLLERTQQAIQSGDMGPERLRSLLAQLRPRDIGLKPEMLDPDGQVLTHFQMSLLTEGSGTQIFSTTFVQWAARECLRRAEPETLLIRYAPRQQQQTMNEMLTGSTAAGTDPDGSLVDADMGAYYTWLNMRRLSESEQMRFLVWFEGHAEAVVIGPGLPGGTSSDSSMDMHGVLRLLA